MTIPFTPYGLKVPLAEVIKEHAGESSFKSTECSNEMDLESIG